MDINLRKPKFATGPERWLSSGGDWRVPCLVNHACSFSWVFLCCINDTSWNIIVVPNSVRVFWLLLTPREPDASKWIEGELAKPKKATLFLGTAPSFVGVH